MANILEPELSFSITDVTWSHISKWKEGFSELYLKVGIKKPKDGAFSAVAWPLAWKWCHFIEGLYQDHF